MTVCIYRETLIIHAILWCSESGDCNKDEYERRNALWLWNHKNHYFENTAPSVLQSCAEVSAALVVSLRPAQRSRLLSKSPADLHRGLTCSKIWLFYKSHLEASWMLCPNCRCFQECLRILLQSLKALCLAPGGPRSIWKYSGVLVRTTAESGRFACNFRTDLHFANVSEVNLMLLLTMPTSVSLEWCTCRNTVRKNDCCWFFWICVRCTLYLLPHLVVVDSMVQFFVVSILY